MVRLGPRSGLLIECLTSTLLGLEAMHTPKGSGPEEGRLTYDNKDYVHPGQPGHQRSDSTPRRHLGFDPEGHEWLGGS